jgi:hypothetical protein
VKVHGLCWFLLSWYAGLLAASYVLLAFPWKIIFQTLRLPCSPQIRRVVYVVNRLHTCWLQKLVGFTLEHSRQNVVALVTSYRESYYKAAVYSITFSGHSVPTASYRLLYYTIKSLPNASHNTNSYGLLSAQGLQLLQIVSPSWRTKFVAIRGPNVANVIFVDFRPLMSVTFSLKR